MCERECLKLALHELSFSAGRLARAIRAVALPSRIEDLCVAHMARGVMLALDRVRSRAPCLIVSDRKCPRQELARLSPVQPFALNSEREVPVRAHA